MIDFKKKMKEPGKEKEPPKLDDGWTRIRYTDIKATTDKATLFVTEDGIEIWIPNSLKKLHTSFDLVDIQNWFYDKELG